MPEPESLEALLAAANAALERGQAERARRLFEILTLDHPYLAPAWDGLARAHAAEGNPQAAGACFRRAARLDPRAWAPRLNYGLALEQAGRPREALRWLRAAAAVAPGERRVLRELARCQALAGQARPALRTLRAALAQPEGAVADADLHLAIANLESQQGELAAADRAYEQACLLRPGDAEILYHWAVLSARAGDPESADSLAAQVQRLEPAGVRGWLLRVRLAWDLAAWATVETLLAAAPQQPGLTEAVRAETSRLRAHRKAAREGALAALRAGATGAAADLALETLRELRGMRGVARGFRLVLETDGGDWNAYRTVVALAEDAGQAAWFVAEIQEALAEPPAAVSEMETFTADGGALLGVYQWGALSRRFSRAGFGAECAPE
jgi:Tfp pilus assembly protein PilF